MSLHKGVLMRRRLAVIGVSMLFGLAPAVSSVIASTTAVSEAVTGGSLTIASPGSVTLSGVTAAGTNQTVTGTVTGVAPSDERGTGVGYSVTLTTSNLGLAGASAQKRKTASGGGSTSTTTDVTVTGTYDGLNPQAAYSGSGAVPSGEFVVTVATVSGALPATVNITKPDTTTLTGQTVSSNAVSFNGLTVTFGGSDTFAVNDAFRIRVDHFAYTELTDTPSTLAGSGTPAASTTGVTLGSSSAFTGATATSNALTTFTAAANSGMGGYTYNDGLSWIVHSNPMSGTYNATLTYTIS